MCEGKANADLRTVMSDNHIPFWKIAEEIGMTEGTVVRWFRTELKPVQRGMVLSAIESIRAQQNDTGGD